MQVSLMVAEGVFVGAVLLVAYRLRGLFGPSLVYIIFGIIFLFASLLAGSFYLRLTPWLVVSPGSVVLFPAVLFFVLLVYLSSDAVEARKLIYGVSGANIAMLPIGTIIAIQVQSPESFNPYHLVPDLFTSQPRFVISSATILFVDSLLVVLTYEFISRYTESRFLRIAFSLVATMYFDSVCFVTATQLESPAYADILLSQLVGKTVAGLVFAGILAFYLHRFKVSENIVIAEGRTLGAIFRLLTYRQRYEELQRVMLRDALTGIYNRGYFDDALRTQVAAAERSGKPLCLLMIDVDDFKRVNDAYGHTEGDAVLQLIAQALVASVRSSDDVCRYGGDEFAILLPETELEQAVVLADRIAVNVPAACASGWQGADRTTVTVTIGVAIFPADATTGRDLLQVADRRLYAGKAAGRNRVIDVDAAS